MFGVYQIEKRVGLGSRSCWWSAHRRSMHPYSCKNWRRRASRKGNARVCVCGGGGIEEGMVRIGEQEGHKEGRMAGKGSVGDLWGYTPLASATPPPLTKSARWNKAREKISSSSSSTARFTTHWRQNDVRPTTRCHRDFRWQTSRTMATAYRVCRYGKRRKTERVGWNRAN